MPIYSTQQTQMKIYMGKAPNVNDDHIIDDISFKMNVVTKSADYTVKVSESGTLFTTSGATGGVEFTLPSAATGDGCIFWFVNAVDGDLGITGTATEFVAYNDAAADGVSFETAAEQIGCGFEIFGDGTSWCVGPFNGLVDATMTVA